MFREKAFQAILSRDILPLACSQLGLGLEFMYRTDGLIFKIVAVFMKSSSDLTTNMIKGWGKTKNT